MLRKISEVLGNNTAFLWVLLLGGGLLKPIDANIDNNRIDVAPQYGAPAVTLFFSDSEGDYLIPVARRVGSEEDITPRTRVEEFVKGPIAGPEVSGVLSPGTTLTSFSIDDGIAEIALSNVKVTSGLSLSILVESLVRTVAESPEVASVILLFDDQYVNQWGESVPEPVELGVPEKINTENETGKVTATLYHTYGEVDSYLIPFTETLDSNSNIYLNVVERLLAFQGIEDGLRSSIPPKAVIESVEFDDGVVYVDFSEDLIIAYRLKEANALHVRRSIVASLTSLPEVYAVLITINGSELMYYGCNNVVMEFPQTTPWAVNDEFYLTSLDS